MSKDRYVFLATKQDNWQHKPFLATDHAGIEQYIEQHRTTDTYITPNEFKDRTKATKDNIALLKHIVVDLDDHWQGINLQQAQAFIGLLADRFNRDIPTPQRIVYSGRGLHYYVRIQDTTNIALYDLVSRAIERLMDRGVGEYNAMAQVRLHTDKSAVNGNRLYRCVGTYNTEAQAYATGVYASGASYTLEGLIESFLPDLTPITTGKTTAQAVLAQSTGMQFRQYKREFTAQSWRYAAIDDLKQLQTWRNDTLLVQDGLYHIGNNANAHKRNNMLFYFGLLCKHAFNDTQEVLESMQAFNQFYGNHAKSEAEVEATYKSVINHAYKPPKAATMIDTLQISAEEMQLLKVLIDKAEIRRRNTLYNKRVRQNKAAQRAANKASIKAQAQAMHATGASYRAIADQLNIGLATAHRWCK